MKGILLALFAISITEGALAQYNADHHERVIRGRCTSLRDWEERMGCMNGDITIIEQIRRRERAEARAAAYRRKQEEAPRFARVPREEVAPAPRPAPERARPAIRDSETVMNPPAPLPPAAAPRAPGRTGPIAGTSPLPGPREEMYSPPADPVKPRVINPGSVPAETPAKPQADAPATAAKPETAKPDDAKTEAIKPDLPQTFPTKCARTLKDLEKSPELMAAFERIMGRKPQRGTVGRFEMTGKKRDIGSHCYGIWSGGIYTCENMITDNEPILSRVNSETNELQTYGNKEWVSVKMCSDGSKITNEFSLKTPLGSTLYVTAVFKRFGDVIQYSSTIQENAGKRIALGNGNVVPLEERTGFVAGRQRNVSGRN